jgi:hypothetical protein
MHEHHKPKTWFFLWGERGMGRAKQKAKTRFIVPKRQLQSRQYYQTVHSQNDIGLLPD